MVSDFSDILHMSFKDEFKTIVLLQESRAKTRGVDAFALALIKAERQARKLFTFLVFQSPAFSRSTIPDLRNTLAKKKTIYFDGFLRGLDAVSPVSVQQLVGSDYARLRQVLFEATNIRNKIFHGQVTNRSLSRDDLFHFVDQIGEWCRHLANGATRELGYDGFGRNSYRKGTSPPRLRVSISSIDEYDAFLDRVLSRGTRRRNGSRNGPRPRPTAVDRDRRPR
jgi:hypothetical protein